MSFVAFRSAALFIALVAVLPTARLARGADLAASPAKPTAGPAPQPACHTTAKKQRIAVHLATPKDTPVTAVTIVVEYPDGLLNLPDNQNLDKLKARVGRLPANSILGVSQRDKTLRVVLGKTPSLPNGELFTVEFDRCAGAQPAATRNFSCTVETAANSFGDVSNVACSLYVP